MIVCHWLIELQFLWLSIAWASIKRLFPPQEDLSTRQQGPPSLISADRGLWQLTWVFPIIHASVTFLLHPWVGLKKELVWVCVFSTYLLTPHWGLLVWILSVTLTGVQCSTPALSCCQENVFWEHYLFPLGTTSTFWRNQPVGGTWTSLTGCGVLGLVSKHLIIL